MKGLLLDSGYVRRGENPHMRLYVKDGKDVVTCIDRNFSPYLYAVAKKPASVAKAIGKLEVERDGQTLAPKSVEGRAFGQEFLYGSDAAERIERTVTDLGI